MPDRPIVILPTYNERENLERLVLELRAKLAEADLLVVDDASPDGTGDIADRLAAADPRVHVLHRPGKLGLGTAHMDAMDWALAHDYRAVITMDCDHTHRPDDARALLTLLDSSGADVAVGTRYAGDGIASWPLWRQVISRTAHLATRLLLAMPHDATSALRVYRAAALRRVPYRSIRGEGYSFMFEMLHLCMQHGLRVVEIPVVMPFRQEGSSKISRREVVRAVTALGRLTVRRIVGRGRPHPAASERAT